MLDVCVKEFEDCDVAIMAAAPADYRLEKPFDNKVKSDTLTLTFVKIPTLPKRSGKAKVKENLSFFLRKRKI